MSLTIAKLEARGKRWLVVACIIQAVHLVTFIILYAGLPAQIPMRPDPGPKWYLLIFEALALFVFLFIFRIRMNKSRLKLNWPVKPENENATQTAALWLLSVLMMVVAFIFFAIMLMVYLTAMNFIHKFSPLWAILIIFGNIIIIMRSIMLMQDANAGRLK